MTDKIPVKAYEHTGINEDQTTREVILSYNEDDAEIDQAFRIDETDELYDTEWIAVLAHRLWTHWSQHIAEEEDISQDRVERWQSLWNRFEELSPEMQQKDVDLVERFLKETPDYSKGENP